MRLTTHLIHASISWNMKINHGNRQEDAGTF